MSLGALHRPCPFARCTGTLDDIGPQMVSWRPCGHTLPRSEYDRVAERGRRTATEQYPGTDQRAELPPEARLRVVRLADVRPEPVRFVPGGYIPEAMMSLLVGDPGLGKTRLLLELGAAVTRGRAWPEGGETSEPANVLFCGHEDTLEHVIRPVFDALGGDPARFFAIDALVKEDRAGGIRESAFALTPDGLAALEAALREYRPRVLLIDPITGHLGKVDSFKDADVRSVLVPLARAARAYGCAVVGNAHLNKATQQAVAYRIGASIAFRAVARAVFYVAPDPHDPGGTRVLLFHDKSNVAAKQPPRGYQVIDRDGVGVVAWDRDPVTCTLADALGANVGGGDRGEQTEAERFLADLLANGPMLAAEVDAARNRAGIAPRTLNRAKARLGVVSEREGFGPGALYKWRLPGRGAAAANAGPHGMPESPTMQIMANHGHPWQPMTNGPGPIGPMDGHALPSVAMGRQTGAVGNPCARCGRPAAAEWKGERVCFGCHPLGTVATVLGAA